LVWPDNTLPRPFFSILGHFPHANALAPTDDGRVRCLFCTKTFTVVANARRHIKEKHQEHNGEVFQCHLCSASFRIQRYYHEHLYKKHEISHRMLKNSFMWPLKYISMKKGSHYCLNSNDNLLIDWASSLCLVEGFKQLLNLSCK
jgi:hypothetical protein